MEGFGRINCRVSNALAAMQGKLRIKDVDCSMTKNLMGPVTQFVSALCNCTCCSNKQW
jgi:hypothetical protein